MKDKKILTIPNILSLARLLFLIPIVFAVLHQNRWQALIWILASIASDNLDGYIARKFNQQSDLGRILDPLIDKINLVVVSAVLVFSPGYSFPLWFFLFSLFREMLVLFGGWWIIRKKQVVLEANRAGKMSAFATGFLILFFVMDWQPYAWILLWTTFTLTLISTVTYVHTYLAQTERRD